MMTIKLDSFAFTEARMRENIELSWRIEHPVVSSDIKEFYEREVLKRLINELICSLGGDENEIAASRRSRTG